ncbi:MAG: glycoside hydrolase family 38 C-terminal domain-containing protein [bacterium]
MPKRQSYRITIVPETHWDRAWYIPFEPFRIRLVRLIDRLLEGLKKDPAFTCFTLDGQTVVIEDYLQIRPEKQAEIEEMVRAGRLFVGPWYILPDEFIVSGESLIRNLLIGEKISTALGHRMSVGYVPDPFGHIGQLPQILRGFRLDNFIFSRGLLDREKLGLEFLWKAPDGSSVLAIYQRFFYNNAAFLGYPMEWGDPENLRFDMSLALQQIKGSVENLGERTKGRSLLLNNGVDHSEHQPELPRIVSRARRKFKDWDIRIGSFEDYIQNISKDLKDKRLRTLNGEITYRYGDLLTGVYSSRMYLKQANHRCETLLERYCEPLEALARLAGKPDDTQAVIDYAWRELLKNHPHDDICGCSVDAVHRDNVNRFERVKQVAETLCTENLRRIAHRMDHSGRDGVPHVLFNPSGFSRRGAQRFRIQLHHSETDLLNGFRLVNHAGKSIPFTVQMHQREYWAECCKPCDMETIEIIADPGVLPAFGWTTLYVQPERASTPKVRDPIRANDRTLENKQVKITAADDGNLTLRDKQTGKVYRGLGIFEDQEDGGDEYNWSHIKNSKVVVSKGLKAKIKLIDSGPLSATLRIQHRLRIPDSLSKNRTERSRKMVLLPITTELTLRSGSRVVEFRTTVDNAARDHRLRVLFPTGIHAEHVSVDEHFDVVERSTARPPEIVRDDRRTPPYPTEHQKQFVDVSDGKHGLAVINVGLPEYESIPARNGVTIALTLFRSVGQLSRGDMLTRPGDTGPSLLTPEAQCQGTMSFEYGLCAHRGDWETGRVLQESRALNQPILVTRADLHGGSQIEGSQCGIRIPKEGPLPDVFEVVDLEPDCLVLSTLKNAETGRGLICRFYNPTNESVNAVIRFGLPVSSICEVSLDERPIRKGKAVTRPVVRMRVRAKKIVTLLVRCAAQR